MPLPPTDAAGTPAAVQRAYRDLGVVGYVLYGVGAASPFLRDALGLSDTQAGLHSSLVAIGLLGAGLLADRLDRRAGPSRVHAGAALLGAVATVLLAWAPALAVTLIAAWLTGLAVGVFIGHVNGLLGSDGGPEARTHLLRANVFGMVGPFVVPLIIALGLGTGIGWQLVFLPALVLLAMSLRDALRHGIPMAERAVAAGRLPRAYWLAWALLVTVIGVEFAVVFWAATLVERQTDASIGDAALARRLLRWDAAGAHRAQRAGRGPDPAAAADAWGAGPGPGRHACGLERPDARSRRYGAGARGPGGRGPVPAGLLPGAGRGSVRARVRRLRGSRSLRVPRSWPRRSWGRRRTSSGSPRRGCWCRVRAWSRSSSPWSPGESRRPADRGRPEVLPEGGRGRGPPHGRLRHGHSRQVGDGRTTIHGVREQRREGGDRSRGSQQGEGLLAARPQRPVSRAQYSASRPSMSPRPSVDSLFWQ